jgi:flagellar hook protein FlgE
MGSSMNSAVSGLRAHQQMLDVVGNNIANVNTPGYKAGRTTFSDILSQTVAGATAPSESVGGTDPQQVGLGVRTGAITNLYTQGGILTTNKPTDLAIQGEGFFVLGDGSTSFYTRAGAFEVDAVGSLVDSVTGYRVQGASGDINISPTATSPPVATTTTFYAGNLDTAAAVSSSYTATMAVNDSLGGSHNLDVTFTKRAAGVWTYGVSDTDATMSVASGASGVLTFTSSGAISSGATAIGSIFTAPDLNDTFIVSVDGGASQTFTFAATDITPALVAAKINSTATPAGLKPLTASVTPAGTIQITSNTSGATADLDVDPTGTANGHLGFAAPWAHPAVSTATGLITLNFTNGAAGAQPVTLDFGSAASTTSVTGFDSPSTLALDSQDGYASGTLQAFSIGTTGSIDGTFSNGRVQAMGTLRLATFSNPAGLSKVGSNLFRETSNSGVANVGDAGTGRRGTLAPGSLEGSNVDLAEEFTKLIVAQRGFQANARVITTSDEVLQEAVNLKR